MYPYLCTHRQSCVWCFIFAFWCSTCSTGSAQNYDHGPRRTGSWRAPIWLNLSMGWFTSASLWAPCFPCRPCHTSCRGKFMFYIHYCCVRMIYGSTLHRNKNMINPWVCTGKHLPLSRVAPVWGMFVDDTTHDMVDLDSCIRRQLCSWQGTSVCQQSVCQAGEFIVLIAGLT